MPSALRRDQRFLVLILLLFLFCTESKARPSFETVCQDLHLAELEGRGWLPQSGSRKLRGVILCLHGFGLNAGSYQNFGERIVKHGFAAFALDARGFGHWRTKNKSPRLDMELTVADTKTILEQLHKEFPNLPVFLLGESMGGAVALTTAAKYPHLVDGVVASVPAAERFDQRRSVISVGLRLLFVPDKEFDVSKKVIDKALSNEELRRLWLTEPQNRLHLSASELLEFQRFMNRSTKLACNIRTTPVLIIQGCRDNLVKPKATVGLYNNIPATDKKLLLVGQAEHLIFQKGLLNQQTMDMVLAWLRTHAPD
ncbi:MAG: lysophospholipase [Candidatus Obscuribacterales bacterium]|nr:lysophospholipase [Candidatus Obscuribacterales bacterium]